MKRVYGRVAVIVRNIKSPLGRDMGKRVYAVAHPPVTKLAFGQHLVVDVERSNILKWSAGDDAAKMMAEMEADGYEPYMV